MSCDLEGTSPTGILHRVGRRPDPWAWPDWSRADPDGTFGNRYDDPRGEYRVLYASSDRRGAYLEVLARYRADPAVQRELGEIEVDPDQADLEGPEPGRGSYSSARPKRATRNSPASTTGHGSATRSRTGPYSSPPSATPR